MKQQSQSKAGQQTGDVRFIYTLSLGVFILMLCVVFLPKPAHSCQFFVPNSEGSPEAGPSFETMDSGMTRGVLDCGSEFHELLIMTMDIDASQSHVGVRDNPLFQTSFTGPLLAVDELGISPTAKLVVLRREREETRIGNRRGYVRFASLCENASGLSPLDCSWGKSRIKFRTTFLDTNSDGEVDRSYHEVSVYNGADKLHLLTFWTPHRAQISATTADWINVLFAFGLDVSKKAG